MPTRFRHKALRNWGFTCTCPLCSAPAQARQASDERRERLVQILLSLDEDAGLTYDHLINLTYEFVQLLETERMIVKVGEYYQIFMRVYYQRFGDAESALRYGETALRYAETFADPDGGFCGGLRDDIELLKRVIKEMQE